MTINVNDKIQDRTIRHAVFLERYKASEVKKIRKILDTEILPEIAEKIEKRLNKILERGSDLGSVTLGRLKELEKELTALSKNLALQTKAGVTVDLDELTKDELDWQVRAIKESLGFDLDMVVPSPRTVARIAKNVSFSGLTLDQWFDSLARSTQKGVMTAVNRGIVEGETTDQIVRRIRGTKKFNYTDGVFETTRNQAETLTRTTINHVTNQARTELFRENDDIIAGMQWTATLDSRTSVICAGLDGKIFPVDKGIRPPAHPNCRSTMTAVLRDAEEIGLNKIPEGKRASVNGQVAASTTYGEWLKRQPVSVQQEVLGIAKAQLFRRGELPIERFTSSTLQPLTLKELKKLEKSAFDRAGL